MNKHYQGTSHLGKMNCDRFVPAKPRTLEDDLKSELMVFINMARNARKEGVVKTYRRAEHMAAELTEQLRIVKAMTPEGKALAEALALRKSIRLFDAETERMKVTA